MSPTVPIPKWINTGLDAVRHFVEVESGDLPPVRTYKYRLPGLQGESVDWPEEVMGAETKVRPGVYAVVLCAAEKSFRGVFTDPSALGMAGGHPGLACEAPVLFAGEIEVDRESRLVAWTNMSGTYATPARYAQQSGLPAHTFHRFVHKSEVAEVSVTHCTIPMPQGHVLAAPLAKLTPPPKRFRGEGEEPFGVVANVWDAPPEVAPMEFDSGDVLDLCVLLHEDALAAEPEVIATEDSDSESILVLTKRVRDVVAKGCPGFAAELQDIVAGALLVLRKRLCDVGLYEHVLMLHLIEGGRHVVAHDGVFYGLADGAWQMFTGVISEGVLRRVKTFFLRLEGMLLVLADEGATADTAIEFMQQNRSSAPPNRCRVRSTKRCGRNGRFG